MNFNVKKSNILLFNCSSGGGSSSSSKGKLSNFSLHSHELEIVEQVKYPGVVSHSVKHEVLAGKKASQYEQQAHINDKLLAYKTLCFSHLECAAAA